jgi:uncharacterized membrane protein (DUF2068 family)
MTRTTDTPQGIGASRHRDRGLELIALFKMLKAVLLVLAGAGVLTLLRPAQATALREWLSAFSIARGQEVIDRVLSMLDVATPRQLTTVGLATICYGLLFATEGVGLWLERRWAEYLTVFATGSLVPFELYELARRATPLRALALAVNAAAVAYLIYRLRHPFDERANA